MFIILRLCLQLIFKINGNAFLYNKTVLLEYNKKNNTKFYNLPLFQHKKLHDRPDWKFQQNEISSQRKN